MFQSHMVTRKFASKEGSAAGKYGLLAQGNKARKGTVWPALRSVGKGRLYPAYWPKKWKSCRGEKQGSHPDKKSKKRKNDI